jgi:hypothetical protein
MQVTREIKQNFITMLHKKEMFFCYSTPYLARPTNLLKYYNLLFRGPFGLAYFELVKTAYAI